MSPEQLLGQLESGAGTVVVADFEAGLGTLTRMQPGDIDLLLVVTEPSAKSVEVSRRALELIAGKNLGRTLVVANRVTGQDRQRLEELFADRALVFVPEDSRLRTADAQGVAPFDAETGSPAVQALSALAESLVQSP